MRRDKTKSILSVIATLISAALILVYWLAPADDASHRLYRLFIDCIPDSLVVLITIPIVYWLLYTRGLTNMGDCPLFTQHNHTAHSHSHHRRTAKSTPPEPARLAPDEHPSNGKQDVLLVVAARDDSAKGPDSGRILTPLNATIRIAEAGEMLVIFVKCHLPPAHSSAEHSRPSKPAPGAANHSSELLQDIYSPPTSTTFDLPVQSQSSACSTMPNHALDMVISNPMVRTVYIAGFAPESRLQAICRIALQHGRRTIALENAIATFDDNVERTEKMWQNLTAEGLMRQECLTAVTSESSS